MYLSLEKRKERSGYSQLHPRSRINLFYRLVCPSAGTTSEEGQVHSQPPPPFQQPRWDRGHLPYRGIHPLRCDPQQPLVPHADVGRLVRASKYRSSSGCHREWQHDSRAASEQEHVSGVYEGEQLSCGRGRGLRGVAVRVFGDIWQLPIGFGEGIERGKELDSCSE